MAPDRGADVDHHNNDLREPHRPSTEEERLRWVIDHDAPLRGPEGEAEDRDERQYYEQKQIKAEDDNREPVKPSSRVWEGLEQYCKCATSHCRRKPSRYALAMRSRGSSDVVPYAGVKLRTAFRHPLWSCLISCFDIWTSSYDQRP